MDYHQEDELRRLVREVLKLALGEQYKGTACDHSWGVVHGPGRKQDWTCSRCGAQRFVR